MLETVANDEVKTGVAESNAPPLFGVGIIIPTYNAEPHWAELSASLTLEGVDPAQVLIIDSTSTDATRELARKSGYRVVCVPHNEFNHGGTRQLACGYFPDAEQLVFCTQDVVFAGNRAIELLSEALDDPAVGAAYGRQMPRLDANAIERHARLFNYPATTQVRTFESRKELGIKTPFFSNSFAIYRRSALDLVGGFPSNVICGEEVYVAARMLMDGLKIVYAADAAVYHSHPISLFAEFSRYFDIGTEHARENWILKAFGNANSEGKKFILSEMRYLMQNAPHLIPLAMLRTVTKLVAYNLGTLERYLPTALKQKISDYPQFWVNGR
jgi:rhamnosyltransferase